MDPIKLSLDPNAYAQKPSGKEIGAISHRIANYPGILNIMIFRQLHGYQDC